MKLSRAEKQSRGIHSQSLFYFKQVDQDAGPARLQWTGDMNGDEKPDLLVSSSDHYNKDETRLYLSYENGGNEMVYEAARMVATGR